MMTDQKHSTERRIGHYERTQHSALHLIVGLTFVAGSVFGALVVILFQGATA